MGNGGAERWNQTLLKMLGTLENYQKSDWKAYLGPLVQAYNATKNDATGYAPHFLMFGWHPRLPVDAYLGTDPSEEHTGNQSSYASKLHQRLQLAYRRAAEEAGKMAAKNKSIYDQKVKHTRLDVGDQVLIRNVGLKGTNKLTDRWAEEIYRVLSMPNPDIPVNRVQQENKKGPIKTLHRNMLLPYSGTHHIEEGVEPRTESSTRRRTPYKLGPTVNTPSTETEDTSDSDSDGNASRVGIYIPPPLRLLKSPQSQPSKTDVTGPVTPEPSQALEFPQCEPSVEPETVTDQFSRTDSLLPQSETETTLVSVDQETSSIPAPDPPPRSPRPVRLRAPPQRYGEWVTPIFAKPSENLEVFV